MFASTSRVSRTFATYGRYIHNTPACNGPAVREVMVSQSRDLNRNTALEDWAVRNLDIKAKNVLILTNNLSLSPTNATVLDIKATLIESNVAEKAAEFEELVLSSLPPSLLLSALPDLERGRALLEPDALSYTVRLQLHTEVKAKDVLNTMNAISRNFLKDENLMRLSLVRPDDGWFQGLESVRAELEKEVGTGCRALARMDQRRAEGRQPASRGLPQGLQNSYGL